jgi:GNAT superfamily N-acetyltransferase
VLSIVAAQEEDVPAIAELLEELDRFYGVTEFDPIDQRTVQIVDMLFGSQPTAYVLVAKEYGNVVGLASYSFLWPAVGLTNSLFLKELFVREERRRSGVGRRLMEHLFDVAVERGCSRVEWMTEDVNTGAQGFYNRLGHDVNTEKLFYRANTSKSTRPG